MDRNAETDGKTTSLLTTTAHYKPLLIYGQTIGWIKVNTVALVLVLSRLMNNQT